MNVLVMVPFKEEHMDRIREAAGEGAVVQQMLMPQGKSALGLFGMPEELQDAVRNADVVIGEPSARFLAGLDPEETNLKWVQMTWAGSDRYTGGRWPWPKGVVLTNVAGAAYGHTMSQYVVGQILNFTQNLSLYVRQQPTQSWVDLGPVKSLEGATVLIYGAGDIGSHVAKRLSGFDVGTVIGVCRNVDEPRPYFDKLVTLPAAEYNLPNADVVVCCMPKSPATTQYFNKHKLERLKEDAVLVNVGRGDFIDLDALYAVMQDGRLRGVALDVTDPEPLPMKHPLWRHPRVNITPHISGGAFGHSEGTEERICQVCCENLRRFVAGEELEHRVL